MLRISTRKSSAEPRCLTSLGGHVAAIWEAKDLELVHVHHLANPYTDLTNSLRGTKYFLRETNTVLEDTNNCLWGTKFFLLETNTVFRDTNNSLRGTKYFLRETNTGFRDTTDSLRGTFRETNDLKDGNRNLGYFYLNHSFLRAVPGLQYDNLVHVHTGHTNVSNDLLVNTITDRVNQ